jgi:glycosyltransferase involved in cell wall biosynthesis
MFDGVPPKVALVASIYGHLTGFHLPYIQLLQKHGCEVHAYAMFGTEKTKLAEWGVVCHDIPFCRSPLKWGNGKALLQLIKSFRIEKFQMVHVHTPVAALLGRIAARLTRVPFTLYTAHGLHFYKGAPLANWIIYYPVEWFMSRWTDILITINREDYERVRRFPVRMRSEYVRGVGLDTQIYKGLLDSPKELRESKRRELGIASDAFILLCIAELNQNKNQKQLLEAVQILVQRGRLVHCLLAGTGEMEVKLREYAHESGVEDHIHFLGYRKDIPELLTVCDAVCLASRREGLPRAVMEAMAAGKPVVGTRIRGIRDLVVDGETGFLVPFADAGLTADALMQLVDYPDLAVRMGLAGQRAVEQFAITAIVDEMETIYLQGLRKAAATVLAVSPELVGTKEV